MEEDFAAAIVGDPGVAADVADRVEWSLRAQGSPLPAIALHLVSAPRGYVMRGPMRAQARLIQVDCWGRTYAEAKLLARKVERLLETLHQRPFGGAFIEGERDDDERPDGAAADGSEDLFRTSLDVRVWHSAT